MNLAIQFQLQNSTIPLAPGPINWNPAQGTAQEILQNVRMILTTVIGTQAYNRRLGVSNAFVDMPINIGMAMVRTLFMLAITAFEPRFITTGITFGDADSAQQGQITATVVGSIQSTAPIQPGVDFATNSGTPTWVIDLDQKGNPEVLQEIVTS